MLYNIESVIGRGKVKQSDIDQALINLFFVLFRLELFNGDPFNGMFGRLGSQHFCTKEHKRALEMSLEAARNLSSYMDIPMFGNTISLNSINKLSQYVGVMYQSLEFHAMPKPMLRVYKHTSRRQLMLADALMQLVTQIQNLMKPSLWLKCLIMLVLAIGLDLT
ncbi:putative beta-D-xylosidase 6 [Bienertia sinuspersici]